MPSISSSKDRLDRLRAGLQGKRSRSTLGKPADGNILTSIALHALGRQRRGKTPLSELEKLTMGLYDKMVESDDELDAFIEAVSSTRRSRSGGDGGWLTPATLALGEDEPYTKEHFQKDLASMGFSANSTSPQLPAHCRVIDPSTSEQLDDAEDASFQVGVKEAGRSTTLYWSDFEDTDDGSSISTASWDGVRVKLRPTLFYCHHKSGEKSKDEIFWTLASGADSGDRLSAHQITPETGSVRSKTWYNFPSNYVLFDGRVSRVLSAYIVCWEADNSNSDWYDQLIKVTRAISDKCAEFSVTGDGILDELIGVLPGVGGAMDILYWAELTAGLISRFLEVFRNHDDKVSEAHLAWSIPALNKMHMDHPLSEICVKFDGGDGGKHDLYIKRERQSNNFPGRLVRTFTSNSLTSWDTPKSSNINGTVSMDEQAGKLWSAVALDADDSIGVTDKPLVHIGDLNKIKDHRSVSRVDILVDHSAIHLVYQTMDDRLMYVRGSFDFTSRSSNDFQKTIIAKAPNICQIRDELIGIFYCRNQSHYWMKLSNNDGGKRHRMQAHRPSAGPAGACALGDAIYYFYADSSYRIRVAVIRWEHVHGNRDSIEDYDLAPFETRGGISATVRKGQIYIAYATIEPDQKPCIDRYDVNKRCLVSVNVFNDEYCDSGDPALGVLDGRLYITNRRKP